MAWQNAILEDFTTGTITGDIETISTVVNPQSKQAGSTDYFANFDYAISFHQILYVDIPIDSREIILGNLELGLSITRDSLGFIKLDYTYYTDGVLSYRTLKQWSRSAIKAYSSEQHNCSIFATIDETTQKGTIIAYSIDFDTGYWSRLDHSISYANELTNTDLAYSIIKANAYVQYNWQSVPSISGKNGILTLSTLNDINDGEPVETSDTSKFNLTDDSNVSTLVAAHFSE